MAAADQRVAFAVAEHYVTEGIDNIGSGGIFTTTYEASNGTLAGSVWFGIGTERNYREVEVNLSAEKTIFANTTATIGIHNIDVHTNRESDNDWEVSLALSRELGRGSTKIETYYSHNVGGAYLNVAQSFDLAICSAFVELGYNNGYVPGSPDGITNWVAGATKSMDFEGYRLELTLAHTHALDQGETTLQGNLTWATLTLELPAW